ncbi:MAG: DUF3796 domain-containing protein [Lachnospiraceae bacterium]|nr:DUF3796 domain-containing protein [Lachnospiraceae bacterium]
MKKNKMKIWVGCGILCVLSVLISSWYAVAFNDSRLVVPTDFENYVFHAKDLPMIISVLITCIYMFAIAIRLFIKIRKRQKQVEETAVHRKVNPGLGFLGLFGFLGFAGFWTYSLNGTVYPFAFFLFFGFFGFFYEGKMSGTFMDERFRENADRARLKAYRITFEVMFVALVILCQGKLFGSLEHTLIAAIIILSLALASGLFLSEYLLYRYDHDGQTDEGEE